MKVNEDFLRVNVGPVDRVHGAAPEPEERPVEHVMDTTIAAKLGDSPNDPNAVPLDMPGDARVIAETTVAETARGLSEQCQHCRDFDRKGWLALKQKWATGTKEEQLKLNDVRGCLMDSGNAAVVEMSPARPDKRDEMDVEHALNLLGICRAFSPLFREEIIIHPLATCPSTGPNGELLPRMFKARDRRAAVAAGQAKDVVLRTAQGTPGVTRFGR